MKLAPQFWLLLIATVVVNTAACGWAMRIEDHSFQQYLFAACVLMGLCFIQVPLLGAWLVLGEMWWPTRVFMVGVGTAAWVRCLGSLFAFTAPQGLGAVAIQLASGILVGLAWRGGNYRLLNHRQPVNSGRKLTPRPRQYSLGALMGLITVSAVATAVAKHAIFSWSLWTALVFLANAGMSGLGLWSLTTEQRSIKWSAGILLIGLLAGSLTPLTFTRSQFFLESTTMHLVSAIFVIIWVEVCRSAQLRLVQVGGEIEAIEDVPI